MPFKTVIEPARHLVLTTGAGVITGEEALRYSSELKQHADFDPSFNQLVDLTHVTFFNVTKLQLEAIATQPFFSTPSKRAIVATSPAIFGLLRMFESYRSFSDVGEQIMVFRKMEEATDWLAA